MVQADNMANKSYNMELCDVIYSSAATRSNRDSVTLYHR